MLDEEMRCCNETLVDWEACNRKKELQYAAIQRPFFAVEERSKRVCKHKASAHMGRLVYVHMLFTRERHNASNFVCTSESFLLVVYNFRQQQIHSYLLADRETPHRSIRAK